MLHAVTLGWFWKADGSGCKQPATLECLADRPLDRHSVHRGRLVSNASMLGPRCLSNIFYDGHFSVWPVFSFLLSGTARAWHLFDINILILGERVPPIGKQFPGTCFHQTHQHMEPNVYLKRLLPHFLWKPCFGCWQPDNVLVLRLPGGNSPALPEEACCRRSRLLLVFMLLPARKSGSYYHIRYVFLLRVWDKILSPAGGRKWRWEEQYMSGKSSAATRMFKGVKPLKEAAGRDLTRIKVLGWTQWKRSAKYILFLTQSQPKVCWFFTFVTSFTTLVLKFGFVFKPD